MCLAKQEVLYHHWFLARIFQQCNTLCSFACHSRSQIREEGEGVYIRSGPARMFVSVLVSL